MTEKEIVLETIRALPDDCSLEEIAERIEFMASKKTTSLMAYKLVWSPAARDDLHD